ncbi:immunoglobulin superfamily member 1-like isoform X2 [Lampris incognitus]|uniref:immunoglobulin superfamily member 1-like isoform X2 n=1 Tax=Lampris incognitus TaxID=2546036 RepID=UPI0024B52E24|nr:immunoglobulin superfamily member 1-like isoform X2 [Lampris incognitus]
MVATLLTVSKMPVAREPSLCLWIYILSFTSLPHLVLPVPSLEVLSRSKGSLVLVCRAPAGHRGVQFTLYRDKDQVDSKEDRHGTQEARFTIRVDKGGTSQQNLYCCLYKSQRGIYSAFSPYLILDSQEDAAPTPSSFPAPVLTVEPSSGLVKRGDILSFHCSLPPPLPLSQPQRGSKPVSFLLLKTAGVIGAPSMVLHPQAIQVSNSTDQQGAFSVGPVRGGEGGSYTCLYQIPRKRATVNSTFSNTIQVTIADLLPAPTLIPQQQAGVLHLVCTGSPAYPGAVFSLYKADEKVPVATHHTPTTHHQAIFPVPVQEASLVSYQCQYSVLLVREWSNSERSLPTAISKGVSPPFPPGMDLPLVMGCFSAVVLFFFALVLVVVMAHRKVKAAADEKKKREEAQFWSTAHNNDHLVDLKLRRASFTAQGWASEKTTTERLSRSPLWSPLSTFESPAFN